MNWRRAAVGLVLSLGACGGPAAPAAPPDAPPPSQPPPSSSLAELEGSSNTVDEPAAPDPASCYEGCAKQIDAARVRMRRARGLAKTPKAAELFSKAGEAWVNAWRGCNLTLPAGLDRGCEHADEVTPQMLEAFDSSGRVDRQVFARLVALDPRWSAASSPLREPARSKLEELASQIESANAKIPKDRSADVLAAAVYARLALGNVGRAEKNAARLAQRHPGSEQAALAASALAEAHADAGEHREALAALSPGTRPSGKLPSRVQVVWHAARGRALAGLGRTAQAEPELRQVIRLHQAAGKKDLADRIGHAEPWPMLGRERVVASVGAAHFLLAEPLAKRAEKLSMPRYSGPATPKGVTEFVRTRVAKWIAEKQQRLVEAVEAYQAVMGVEPVPPPRWVVAAAARVGQLWAGFAEDFEKAPVPPALASDPELRAGYQNALDEAMEPLLEKARRAFEVCEDAAKQHRVRSEHADACRSWLDAHSAP